MPKLLKKPSLLRCKSGIKWIKRVINGIFKGCVTSFSGIYRINILVQNGFFGKISKKNPAEFMQMTPNGLRLAMKNDDFKLSQLKLFANFFEVDVSLFISDDTTSIVNDPAVDYSKSDLTQSEIEFLRRELELKNTIIELQKKLLENKK